MPAPESTSTVSSAYAESLLEEVSLLDAQSIEDHPSINTILHELGGWLGDDRKELADKWVEWLADALPKFASTAGADLHGRAIRRLRRLAAGNNLPAEWAIPNDQITSPGPNDQLKAGIWLTKYHKPGLQNPLPVCVKGYGQIRKLDSRRRENFAELIVGLSLIHPNIVPFYGYMKDWVAWDEPTIIPQSPLVYKLSIVSLYMPKLDVLDYVRSHPLLTALDRLRLVRDLCRGVQYLHAREVLHGDIKSSNFWIDEDGVGRLGDMGCAHAAIDSGAAGTSFFTFWVDGTLAYRAPELWYNWENPSGRKFELSNATDMYSFSVTAWEILSCMRYTAPLGTPHRQIQTMFRVLDQTLRPSPRPVICAEPQYDEFWELIQYGWHINLLWRPHADEYEHALSPFFDS